MKELRAQATQEQENWYDIGITDKNGCAGRLQMPATTKAEALEYTHSYMQKWNLEPVKIQFCKKSYLVEE